MYSEEFEIYCSKCGSRPMMLKSPTDTSHKVTEFPSHCTKCGTEYTIAIIVPTRAKKEQ